MCRVIRFVKLFSFTNITCNLYATLPRATFLSADRRVVVCENESILSNSALKWKRTMKGHQLLGALNFHIEILNYLFLSLRTNIIYSFSKSVTISIDEKMIISIYKKPRQLKQDTLSQHRLNRLCVDICTCLGYVFIYLKIFPKCWL